MSTKRLNRNVSSPARITQDRWLDDAMADAVSPGILVTGDVVTTNSNTSAILVGQDNLVRVIVSSTTGTTYLHFGDSSLGAPTSTSTPALQLEPGEYLIAATGDYLRTSNDLANTANADRIEIIERSNQRS